MARSLIVVSCPACSSFCSVDDRASTRADWAKAANSAQANAMRKARPALPTFAWRSMPESGAINATIAGGTARAGRGAPASVDTIKTDLRDCRPVREQHTAISPGSVTSGRAGVTMAGYATAVGSAPDHLAARRRASLPDGRRCGYHVQVRAQARPHLRRPRTIESSSELLTRCVALDRAGQLVQDRLENRGPWQLGDSPFQPARKAARG